MSQVYTVTEVSEMFKISKSLIYKYAEAGKIPSVKIGTSLRFTEAQINGFLSENTKTTKLSEEKTEEQPIP